MIKQKGTNVWHVAVIMKAANFTDSQCFKRCAMHAESISGCSGMHRAQQDGTK
jgi:hypothetical protein